MSRRANRRRRSERSLYGGLLRFLLSVPAQLRIRWLVIGTVMLAAMGAYGHALVTAPPMPPGKAPAVSGTGRTPPHGIASAAASR